MDQNLIAANLAAVQDHFHCEDSGEVEKALDLYTDDIVWECPARRLVFQGKQSVADNYRTMFASMGGVEFTCLQRFATEDRVVDDSLVRFRLTGEGVVNAPLPVGADVELRLVHIFEMRSSKIARELVYEMWRQVPSQ